jgi:hypothetical protein
LKQASTTREVLQGLSKVHLVLIAPAILPAWILMQDGPDGTTCWTDNSEKFGQIGLPS